MSSSRRKAEHIERIRYPNPLPLPPYPPKLLSIETPLSRFTDPRTFGQRLAQVHPLPVVVDAEAGMPINLTDFPQAWYTDQELEADDDVYPKLDTNEVEVDPEDAFLLSDILEKLPAGGANGSTDPSRPPGVIDSSNVTWLRRTEYLAAEEKKRKRSEMMNRGAGEVIDTSREAQIARIKEAFHLANAPLSTLRHPTKSHLKAVDSYSFLPDPDTWATQFDVFRFGDLPGRLKDNKPLPDPRLATSILRPHLDLVGQPLYSLFLIDIPQEEESVNPETEDKDGKPDGGDDIFGEEDDKDEEAVEKERLGKRSRIAYRSLEDTITLEQEESARATFVRASGMQADAEEQDAEETPFDTVQSEEEPVLLGHVRDYEAHDESARKDQELILTFVDSKSADKQTVDGQLPPAVKFERSYRQAPKSDGDTKADDSGIVYYHPVSLRASMRVKRRRANDPMPPEHWDAIRLGKRSFSMYEKIDRLHERKAVDDLDHARVPERIEIPVEDVEEEDGVAAPAVYNEDDKVKKAEVDEQEGDEKTNVGGGEDEGDENDKDEGDEDEEQKADLNSEGDDDQSGSGSEGAQSDEEMDEDELAALRAEAGIEAVDEHKSDAEDGGRRRSRRAAVNAPDVSNVQHKTRDLLAMDVDEED